MQLRVLQCGYESNACGFRVVKSRKFNQSEVSLRQRIEPIRLLKWIDDELAIEPPVLVLTELDNLSLKIQSWSTAWPVDVEINRELPALGRGLICGSVGYSLSTNTSALRFIAF